MHVPPHIRTPWLWGPRSPLGLGAAIAVVAADQGHKWWMLAIYGIREGQRVAVLPFLDIVFVINPGISWGLFSRHSGGQWFWTALAGVAVCAMVLWLARGVSSGLVAVSVGLIMGGAVSNAIDRLWLGGVADFFEPHALGWRWPAVFNIADAAIVAGVAGLLYDSLRVSRNDASKAM
jgi:signal peptidase II